MQSPTSTQHDSTPQQPTKCDIFAKYKFGVGLAQMPFRLFKAQPSIKKNRKKCAARGPYRRYTSEQKLEIIQRMLSGESLKKIAERTMIPKRNLIRWKHEYLHRHRQQDRAMESEDESVEVECVETLTKKDVSETRQLLATESMESIRIHQLYL